ncbi:2OG-Fe(II) oxygenase [Shewanella cyperi]|uniref:2OG-Fe(II) oxygenase n=1 Tax=Shewanella cyperi TaxID=2814292 RepID=A0A974XN06_9GAMM|nr:2OG-Fe(II) oxygenase [Shewanella cyperi]QSX31386.1 2OG-Fe(II) oxygenase [Shewanella cyperi]QSX42174.1 2OG-Fe(II) oxygenase [Shewanella cyperi]
MVSQLSEAVLDVIADALVDKGYLCLSEVFPAELTDALRRCLLEEELRPAAIGRGAEQQLNRDIRRDKIRWLETHYEPDSHYLDLMEQLKQGLNRRLFLGLFDYESHYALYEPGAFYRKHVDALKGSQNRILTTVYFMNPDWQPGQGGELLIYDETQQLLETVAPTHGKLVIFLSERFPHEVLPTKVRRASIAGWFRVAGSRHGF